MGSAYYPKRPSHSDRTPYQFRGIPGENPYATGEIRQMTDIGKRSLNQEEMLNMNILYLESIHALMNQYILAAFRGDMEQSLNTLMLMANTISPKIDCTDEEKMIEYTERQLPALVMRDNDGQISRYNPSGLALARKQVRTIYKRLLHKVDEAGMLTFQPKDFKSILGDFGKS